MMNNFVKLKMLTHVCVVLFISLFLIPQSMFAIEQQTRTITGTVIDETGEPLPGATVIIKGTSNGTATDNSGKFTLSNVSSTTILTFAYIGYTKQEVTIGNQTNITVQMAEDSKVLGEVVVVGYGTQTKATITGAVSAVRGSEIITTKNENVQNMLTGKIAGVRVTQRTAEPGAFDNRFDVRGMGTPLVIIDGVPRTMDELQRMNPVDIENISVLKDASAAIYGVRAANGVVLVTTKSGTSTGTMKPQLSYSGSYTMQLPAGFPETVNAMDYMTLRNERSMHNVGGGNLVFNDADFDAYRSGAKQTTDWYSHTVQNIAPQTEHTLSATGGNDHTHYYVGLGYNYQEAIWKSGDLNYNKYNVRSNLSTKITKRLTFDINLNAVVDQQNQPWKSSYDIVRSFWRQGPHIPVYADPEQTMLFHGLIEGENPVAFMQQDVVGYRIYEKNWLQGTASLKYDIPGIEGLFVKGMFNYDYYVSNTKLFQKEYNQYRFDDASQSYTKYTRQSPNSIERQTYMKKQILSQATLNYDRTFDVHKVGATLVWESQRRESDNFFAKRNLALPLEYLFAGVSLDQQATMNANADALYIRANNALAGKFNYTYKDKYIADVLFRYDGSSMFGPDYQWGFFPAALVGWRLSEEDFFKESALSFIDQLKLRASYGKTGDDSASSYQFISGYNYPTKSDRRNFAGGYVFGGNWVGSADNKGIPNPMITWYTAKAFNAGIDFSAWNGLFGFTFEYFNRDREGLLERRTGGIPTVVGASLPEENLNSDRTFGLELELTHRNKINDFTYSLKGITSITRVKRLDWESPARGSSWDYWKNDQNNRLQGVHTARNSAGRFTSWEQIWNHPVYIGRGTILGDYIYEDWNGDGEINDNDIHAVRFDQTPWLNFSLTFEGAWRGFDANILLQGTALGSLRYGEQLREPLWGSGDASAMAQFMDRWHPADPKADPYDPATVWIPGHFAYTGTLPNDRSPFNTEDGAYLRLKTFELGYTFPKIGGIQNLRLFVNTYNILTLTKVKNVDPEHPADSYGYLYPMNKSVSVGLNVSF